MKKAILHILFFILIGEATNFLQFAKLPKLYEHFQDHTRRDASITFMDFLGMHYWGNDLDDNDDDKDMQLPFKSPHITVVSFLFVPHLQKETIQNPRVGIVERDYPLERQQFYFNPAADCLFRPPRA
ncbi:hypothetical protein [Chitinophaga skermanii]|uniref:hypothetical protein n=1 Tax=Chitinophaga skermanii TaxID=331697 RepID=UPI0011E5CA46|nr:hypothetical protein [Chitinophaga skermanii]